MISAKKRIWGWYFFDWASQPYNTLLLTFIFAPYFSEVARAHFMAAGLEHGPAAAEAQAIWGYGQSAAGLLIAVLAPVLGAIADGSGRRMVWIWIFSAFYVIGAAGLWWLAPDSPDLLLAVACFGLGLMGMEFATIFTNALMPSLAGPHEMGKISGSGFAFGYLGGLVALVIMLLGFAENSVTGRTLLGIEPVLGLDPALREGTRAVGPFTAIWYVLFMVPFFLWVREPPTDQIRRSAGRALRDLVVLVRELPQRPSLFAWLSSSMFFRDALNALYAFGGIYASGVLGWSIIQIGVFGITGAMAAALASWLGGKLDTARGPKPVIIVSVSVLVVVCLVIAGMSRQSFWGLSLPPGSGLPDILMYLCGVLIGGAGGTLQAASRTMMVFHTTAGRATEAFGLYALSGKATAFIAPLAIAVFSDLSGSQRIGVIPLIALFLLALVLLSWVKPNGEQAHI